jgi:hypothetical protein
VRVRERSPDGTWGSTKTLWRAPAEPVYSSEGVSVATDDAGDTAVMWTIAPNRIADPQPSQLLVATRASSGAFATPAVLDSTAAETTPALAVRPDGEVTALWAGPWRSSPESLYSQTWHAGSQPAGGATALDQTTRAQASFSALSLQTASSGEQLALWLNGRRGDQGQPDLAALRAAWRSPSGGFEAAQTVTSAGVEAREPVLDLSSRGRALLVWSEIAADGSGPLLNYVTASPGAPLTAGAPFAVTPAPADEQFDEHELGATWLPGGRALLAWDAGHVEYADEVPPGAAPAAHGVPIRRMPGEDGLVSPEQPVLAGAEDARPVIAWVGHSPADFTSNGVRYAIGANLPRFAGPPAPSARLARKRDVALAGIAIRVACPAACTATIAGAAYSLRLENFESSSASAYARLGTLTAATVELAPGTSRLVRLRLHRNARKRFCRTVRRGDVEAIAVTVTTRTGGGHERRVVLGEEPASKGCGR